MADIVSNKIRIKLNPVDKILVAHHLGKNGDGQKFFTHEVRRLSDPYVPFDTGALKNTAVETATTITYVTPYARRQWYTNNGSGMRGREWCLRMWAARRNEIINNVARYCGGRS